MSDPRIIVIGTTGSGKTTLSGRLAAIYCIPHIELDALHWQKGWVETELAQFRTLVAQAVAAPAWVTDGNYAKVRDIVWPRASMVVWLDYPLPVILWQLTSRTLQRVVRQEVLWNGNRETWRDGFFGKDSLFRWALKTYQRHRTLYPQLFAQPEHAHLQVVRLRSRAETQRWLSSLQTGD